MRSLKTAAQAEFAGLEGERGVLLRFLRLVAEACQRIKRERISIQMIFQVKDAGESRSGEFIAIVIGKGDAQAMTFLCRNTRCHTDIFKGSIAAIVIKNVADRRKLSRRTILAHHGAARLAVLRIPIQVTGYEKVQLAIVIVV